jgi:hypothetical protein
VERTFIQSPITLQRVLKDSAVKSNAQATTSFVVSRPHVQTIVTGKVPATKVSVHVRTGSQDMTAANPATLTVRLVTAPEMTSAPNARRHPAQLKRQVHVHVPTNT